MSPSEKKWYYWGNTKLNAQQYEKMREQQKQFARNNHLIQKCGTISEIDYVLKQKKHGSHFVSEIIEKRMSQLLN